MPDEMSDYTPQLNFYIGTNDTEEEHFENECSPYCAARLPVWNHLWSDATTGEEGGAPPLERALKKLRIVRGLKISPQSSKRANVHDSYLNRRVSVVSAALQEYKEHLCTKVSATLEGCGQQDISAVKEEIHKIQGSGVLKEDFYLITSQENRLDQRVINGEEDGDCTVKCLQICKRRTAK